MTGCRDCHQPITWALTRNKRWMPIDTEPVEDGNVELAMDRQPPFAVVLAGQELLQARADGVALHRTHMSTCKARIRRAAA
jgi:hypothetical protein